MDSRDIALAPNANLADAFTVIGLSCLSHLAGNQPAVLHGEPEGIHQMRVGLRRLRAALSVFKKITRNTNDRDTAWIKSELKWLTEQLGPARDLDVLLRESIRPLRKRCNTDAINALENDIAIRREDAFRHAAAAVASPRYGTLILKLTLWLINGRWRNSACTQRKIQKFARKTIEKRARRIVRHVSDLEQLSDRQRHRLRISVKKLRYATDFFAGLAIKPKSVKSRSRFERHLKELQNVLGTLNDGVVHRRIAGEILHTLRNGSPQQAQETHALRLLISYDRQIARGCLASARKAANGLVR